VRRERSSSISVHERETSMVEVDVHQTSVREIGQIASVIRRLCELRQLHPPSMPAEPAAVDAEFEDVVFNPTAVRLIGHSAKSMGDED
jgi:hypothetical protein